MGITWGGFLRTILSILLLASSSAWACDVPVADIEKHFRQQWDEEGQVTTLPVVIGKQKIFVLSHVDSCGERGCDHSFYYVDGKCAEEGPTLAGKIAWSDDSREFTVRRRSLPTENNKAERTFRYDDVKKRFLEK